MFSIPTNFSTGIQKDVNVLVLTSVAQKRVRCPEFFSYVVDDVL